MPETAPVTDPAVLMQGVIIFIVAGILMVLVALIAGSFLRPKINHPEKLEPYECGEPVIGSSWVQFDLRFYVVALVFVIFDVEIALLYPWAVVYKEAGLAGLWDMLFFFGVLVVGFLYLWRSGYLQWVRSAAGQERGNLLADNAQRFPRWTAARRAARSGSLESTAALERAIEAPTPATGTEVNA